MKLLSICVYGLKGNIEHAAHEDSPDGKLSASLISKIMDSLSNTELLPSDCIYTGKGIYFYLQKDSQYIYLLASRDASSLEMRNKQFKDVREITFTKNYHEFAKKIANPDYFASKLIQTMQNVSGTRDVVLTTLDKVLARGEKLEIVLDKTQKLEDESTSFKKAAMLLNKSEEPLAEKAKRAFCCFFPWCNDRNKEHEPLLKKRHRLR